MWSRCRSRCLSVCDGMSSVVKFDDPSRTVLLCIDSERKYPIFMIHGGWRDQERWEGRWCHHDEWVETSELSWAIVLNQRWSVNWKEALWSDALAQQTEVPAINGIGILCHVSRRENSLWISQSDERHTSARVFLRRFRQLHLTWLVMWARAPDHILTYGSEGILPMFRLLCVLYSLFDVFLTWEWRRRDWTGSCSGSESGVIRDDTCSTGESISCLRRLYVTRFRTLLVTFVCCIIRSHHQNAFQNRQFYKSRNLFTRYDISSSFNICTFEILSVYPILKRISPYTRQYDHDASFTLYSILQRNIKGSKCQWIEGHTNINRSNLKIIDAHVNLMEWSDKYLFVWIENVRNLSYIIFLNRSHHHDVWRESCRHGEHKVSHFIS